MSSDVRLIKISFIIYRSYPWIGPSRIFRDHVSPPECIVKLLVGHADMGKSIKTIPKNIPNVCRTFPGGF